MRILISSLQVSQGGSKGHLHPAIEIGLELKRRGHHVALLPLPSPLDERDREQILRCQIEIIEAPTLPTGLPFSSQILGQLAKNPDTTDQAYRSFLIAPLAFQFEKVLQLVKKFNPDIVVYDLLVYAAPLAARLLQIPDVGYCAGLKLIAEDALTMTYQSVAKKLTAERNNFLTQYALQADFHHLELLSTTYQFVFTHEKFVRHKNNIYPQGTLCVGSLPISESRCQTNQISAKTSIAREDIILCFGSALDPANYPEIMQIIIKLTKVFNRRLMMSSRLANAKVLQDHVTVADFIPLPQLLAHAAILIHHGGANTFSESLTQGTPQILIPLTTDQPIQAAFLKRKRAGIVINPDELTERKLYNAFQKLLNPLDVIHKRIKTMQAMFQDTSGAIVACNYIEKIQGPTSGG